MLRARSRVLLRFAAAGILMLAAANSASSGAIIGPLDPHREAISMSCGFCISVEQAVRRENGHCSGVVIARDEILTGGRIACSTPAPGSFIPAGALHFLVGYRTSRCCSPTRAGVRAMRFGAGFDPLRYGQDLRGRLGGPVTVTESLPAEIEPLRFRREPSPSGTKAVLVGYPRDRAFAMTADRNCGDPGKISAGRLLLQHTCRAPQLLGRTDPGRHRRP